MILYMKLIIYLILFILLLYYLDNKEKFASTSIYKEFNDVNEVTQYDVLNSDKIKSILEYKDLNNVQPNDMNGIDMYKDKYWIMNDKGFSDIYNYESAVTKEPSIAAAAPKETPKETPKESLMDKIKEFEVNGKKYNLIGTASNEYYHQHFLVYEREVPADNVNKEFTPDDKFSNYFREKDNMDEINTKLYEYVLGKVNKDQPEVIYNIGPRSKISSNDVVYFSLGTFQLGPLVVKPIA